MDSSVERRMTPAGSAPAPVQIDNGTFFSTKEFVDIWSRSFADHRSPMAIPVIGSGPPRTMYASQFRSRFGMSYMTLAPGGFFASPGWDDVLETVTLKDLVTRLTGPRTARIVWSVRFDHGPLATGLESFGFRSQRTSTHVLHVDGDYENIFAMYNATMRNQVRKARREGVIVRDARTREDVQAYYQIHTHLVGQTENWAFVYPIDYFFEMLNLPNSARLLVAEYEGKIVAGGLFYRDGYSVMYGHGSMNREYSHVYPGCAVIDHAIRWACETCATSFNFGSSNGIASLEKYKECWGAQVEYNWALEWRNPYLSRLSAFKRRFATTMRGFPSVPLMSRRQISD